MSRPRIKSHWQDEWGLTLAEVMIVIVLLGIVLGIASSTWFGTVESRRVDSAANQLAANLRKAHSTATNRLANQVVTLTANSSEHSVTGSPTRDLDDDPDADLVTIDADATITFKPNGSAILDPSGTNSFSVASVNDPDKCQKLEIETGTSRVGLGAC